MPAPRKYDQETRDRAVRMCQDRRREKPSESAVETRRRVGELLDVAPRRCEVGSSGPRSMAGIVWASCLRPKRGSRSWSERTPRCVGANEILKTASAFFAAAEPDRKLR